MHIDVDVRENKLHQLYPEAFNALLRDHSRFKLFKENRGKHMSKKELAAHECAPENLIIWATNDYSSLGKGFEFKDPITIDKVTGDNGMVVRPRCMKRAEEQMRRIKDKAEVFTPSWVCNVQNNLIDEAWFGRKGVFNEEVVDEDGTHRWITTKAPVRFPDGKTWEDYVRDVRLEITCGEAPYLCSRYDTVTGEPIDIPDRIGLLDRKLRVVSENCDTSKEWILGAKAAYRSTYGYEWQGDNLLLAREAFLCAFLETYQAKFGELPPKRSVKSVAYIISWNLWQMDGLKMVLPGSCKIQYEYKMEIEDNNLVVRKVEHACTACERGELTGHNGIKCFVRKWLPSGGYCDFPFSTLIGQSNR